MIRITYCPRCRGSDENCPACGEPVRALRTAQLTYPTCKSCGLATAPYYSPTSASLIYDLPGSFYVSCPAAEEGRLPMFDMRSLHTSEFVPVSDRIARQRIAIKLDAESSYDSKKE